MTLMFSRSMMDQYEYRIDVTLKSSTSEIRFEGVVVDTGYTGDFSVPSNYLRDLDSLGFRIYHLSPNDSVFDAFGNEISGEEISVCSARLKRLEEYEFGDDDFPVEIMIYGSGDCLLGLKTISNWIAKFDGSNKLLSFIEP